MPDFYAILDEAKLKMNEILSRKMFSELRDIINIKHAARFFE